MTDDQTQLLAKLDHLSAQLDSVERAVRENKDQIDEVDRIANELAEAQKALKAAQVELAAAQAASEKNGRGAKWRNRAIAAVVVVLALVVTGAIVGFRQQHDEDTRKSAQIAQLVAELHAQQEAQEAARLDQRIAGCKAYNVDVVDKVNGILDGIAGQSQNPAAAQALVAQFKLPRRTCTVEGLADYVKSPQGPNAYETKPGG